MDNEEREREGGTEGMLHVLAGVPVSGEGERRKTWGEAGLECDVPVQETPQESKSVTNQTLRFRHKGH